MKYLFLLLILTGCSGAYHLKRAERHILIAKSKGVSIKSDTVYVDRIVKVQVPATNDSAEVNPAIDIISFDDSMALNDSLVIAIHEGTEAINNGTALDKEKTLSSLKRANEEIKALKKKMSKGFLKDSIYHFEPDSLTQIDITVRADQSIGVKHRRKEYAVGERVKIPVSVDETIEAGFTIWNLLGILLFGLVVGFLTGYLIRSRKK